MAIRVTALAAAAAVACLPAARLAVADPLDRPALAAPLAAQSLLLDVARAGDRLVAVGERGHVLLSDDAGENWRQARSVPMRTLLTAVWFVDAERGWAVGHDELILATTDGGETWLRQHQAPEREQPLLDVWFMDPDNGVAVGAYGTYFSTSDGGRSWQRRTFDAAPAPDAPPPSEDDEFAPDYHLNAIRGTGPRWWIAAEAGHVYRSDDAGASWRTLPSPYAGSLFGLLPLGGDSLLVYGLRGHLFRSDDGGQSWRELESGVNAMLTDGAVLTDGSLALVGLAGTVLRSNDGGASWRAEQQADRKGLAGVIEGAGLSLLVVGEGGPRRITR
ncbi:MAG: YCF48-related protein [Steroidobacteraceae bacterium]